MANDTLINDRSPITKKSQGTVFAFPDACKTPTPGGPVPIPYPNIGQSADIANGSSKVMVNGAAAFVKGSSISATSGDEAGSAGGVASSKTKGKAEPQMYSFDVKFEGKNLVRNFDPFIGNDKNTPPVPIMQAQVAPAIPLPPEHEDEPQKCEYCGKDEHPFADTAGNNTGSGGALTQQIFKDSSKDDHPWNTGLNSLQAHHLICSEAMNEDDWAKLCRQFGYNINRKENGVMLPWSMQLACQLAAPLHRSNHQQGRADGIPYPDKIKELVEEIQRKAESGDFCSDPAAFTKELDAISIRVLKKVSSFDYTITKDGADYAAGKRGCGGVPSLRQTKGESCPHDRMHGMAHRKSKAIIAKRTGPLKIGK